MCSATLVVGRVSIPVAPVSGRDSPKPVPLPFHGHRSEILLVTLLSHGEWNEFRGQESNRTHKKRWHKTFSHGKGIRSATTLSGRDRRPEAKPVKECSKPVFP